MPDAFLAQHAATAYRVDAALLMRALSLASPFPLPAEFLASAGWGDADPNKPENNTYLVARWIAAFKALGKSANETLDAMTTASNVPWKPPLAYRMRRSFRRLIQQ